MPHGSHLLLHNGEVLAGRSLCEYGVRKGSVLELVPYEPCVPQSLPEGSPLLSSPDHELVSMAYTIFQKHSWLNTHVDCMAYHQLLSTDLFAAQ